MGYINEKGEAIRSPPPPRPWTVSSPQPSPPRPAPASSTYYVARRLSGKGRGAFIVGMIGLAIFIYYQCNSGNTRQSNNPISQSIVVTQSFAFVTSQGLNIRSSPSTASNNIIGTIYKNDQVEIIERRADRWFKIKDPHGISGYVDSNFLSTSVDQEQSGNITVTSLRVGNTDEKDNWLTNADDSLSSPQMRYLSPVMTYTSNVSGEVIFYIEVIKTDGTPKIDTSSPNSLSYSVKALITDGADQVLNLSGLGNNDSSIYPAGIYTIEVWCNNTCLVSNKITINP